MMGCTKPAEADPCTIRGMYGLEVGRNVIHGSDSEESAKRELAIWFTPEEIVNWEKTIDKHLYEWLIFSSKYLRNLIIKNLI